MAGPSVFESLSNSRFGNFLKSAYQTISSLIKREKATPEVGPESQQRQDNTPQGPSEAPDTPPTSGAKPLERQTSKALEGLQSVLENEKNRRSDLGKQDITPQVTIEPNNTKTSSKSPAPSGPSSPAPSEPTSPAPSEAPSSGQASYRVIFMDPALQRVLDREIARRTNGITDPSEILKIQLLVKANFDTRLLTNDPALLNEINKERGGGLNQEASPASSRVSSGKLEVRWLDGKTNGVGGEKLESPPSPSSPASPASPASQERTASAGRPTTTFADHELKALEAARTARSSGRGAIKKALEEKKGDIAKQQWKEVDQLRENIAQNSPTPGTGAEGIVPGFVKNVVNFFSPPTPQDLDPQPEVPAGVISSNQPPKTVTPTPRKDNIAVFATKPVSSNKENSKQGTSSRASSSSSGRTPFSPVNSSNRTGSNNSSPSKVNSSNRTGSNNTSPSQVSSSNSTPSSNRTGAGSNSPTLTKSSTSSSNTQGTNSSTNSQSTSSGGGSRPKSPTNIEDSSQWGGSYEKKETDYFPNQGNREITARKKEGESLMKQRASRKDNENIANAALARHLKDHNRRANEYELASQFEENAKLKSADTTPPPPNPNHQPQIERRDIKSQKVYEGKIKEVLTKEGWGRRVSNQSVGGVPYGHAPEGRN